MEHKPGSEIPKLHQRIDALRLWAIQQGDVFRSDLATRIAVFSSSLTSKYERDVYWAVPAYLKLLGSSQQREKLETEKTSEITQKIENFIAALENQYGVYF